MAVQKPPRTPWSVVFAFFAPTHSLRVRSRARFWRKSSVLKLPSLARCLHKSLRLEWMMKTNVTSIDTSSRRRKAILETKLAELLKLSGGREELEIQTLADPLDQVRQSTDRDMAVETLNQQTRSINEIRAALERIEDGSYGLCERCEEPIPAKRLDAVPAARMCVMCQSAIEAEGHEAQTVFHDAA